MDLKKFKTKVVKIIQHKFIENMFASFFTALLYFNGNGFTNGKFTGFTNLWINALCVAVFFMLFKRMFKWAFQNSEIRCYFDYTNESGSKLKTHMGEPVEKITYSESKNSMLKFSTEDETAQLLEKEWDKLFTKNKI